jgi:hypothetical protein
MIKSVIYMLFSYQTGHTVHIYPISEGYLRKIYRLRGEANCPSRLSGEGNCRVLFFYQFFVFFRFFHITGVFALENSV